MRQNRVTLAVAAAVVLVLILRMVTYQVRDTEVACVLTFGKPTTDRLEAGPGLKWPWPVQEVRYFDARLRVLKAPLEEMTTRDGRAILVGSFVLWRVSSAQRFIERRRGDVAEAAGSLEKLLRSAQSKTVSEYPFGALVSTDPAQLKYVELEGRILAALKAEVDGTGVEVERVGIRRLGLPKEATEAVFERMRKEREARAAQLRAAGEAEAGKVRAEADQERDTLLGAAEADARRALGEAEREAEAHYKRLAEDPELAIFLKKLEALKELVSKRTTLVLDTSQPPFDLLEGTAPVVTGGK